MLVWGINYLNGNNFFREENRYYAVYERIDGLVESSPVIIKGINVGKVNEITFLKDTTSEMKVLVSFVVRSDIQIPDSSTSQIASINIM